MSKKHIGMIAHVDHKKTSLTAAITKVLAEVQNRPGWRCSGCGVPTPERVTACDCPTACLYDPSDLKLGTTKIDPTTPIAWECKDYADGWIRFETLEQALAYQYDTGCSMRPVRAAFSEGEP